MLQELSASPAPARVTLEATGKKIMRFGGERSRHSRHLVRASNAVKRDERVGNLCPWSSTRRHLYHGASQRPNVGRQSLLLLQHDLRCHPERRSIHLPHHTILQVQVLHLQLLLLLPQFHSIDVLGGSEIRELDAAWCIANENILGLDVAMHNSAAMEVIDSLNKTASVRADELLVQGLRSRELLQQIRQAATGHVFQEHVAHPLTTFFFTPVASQTTYHMLRFQALQHPDLVLHCRQRGVPLRIAAAAAAHNSRFHCKQRTPNLRSSKAQRVVAELQFPNGEYQFPGHFSLTQSLTSKQAKWGKNKHRTTQDLSEETEVLQFRYWRLRVRCLAGGPVEEPTTGFQDLDWFLISPLE
ncbi:unnamed protein product [Sphagnum balticum]